MSITLNAERFMDGSKTATLAPATLSDRACLGPEYEWVSIDSTPLGNTVYEVTHFGRHITRHGAIMNMMSLETGRSYDLGGL